MQSFCGIVLDPALVPIAGWNRRTRELIELESNDVQ